MDQNLTYQKARRIRGTKVTDLLADQLLYEQSFGSAVRKTISLKTQSAVKGIKEKFDPLNVAKFLTGGSSLAPALVGRLLGRDIRDIEYFAGRNRPVRVGAGRGTASKITPLSTGDGDIGGINEQLLKIYNFLKKSEEQDIKRKEKQQNFEEERQLESERRHKELVAALTKLKTGKTQTATAVKKEEGKGFFDGLINNLSEMLNSLKEKVENMFKELKELFEVLGGKKLLFDAIKSLGMILANPLTFVLAGGALLSYLATKIAENPDFQKAFSEQMDPYGLLSAMSGDAGVASTIMSASAKNAREKSLVDNTNETKKELLKGTGFLTKKFDVGTRDYLIKEKGLTPEEADFLMPGNQNNEEKFGKLQDREKILENIQEKSFGRAGAKSGSEAKSMREAEIKQWSTVPNESDAETDRLSRQSAAAAPMPEPKASMVPASVNEQLNTVLAQNAEANLPTKPNTEAQTVVNNLIQNRNNRQQELARLDEIAVHNDEPTFMRMIMGSTRLV